MALAHDLANDLHNKKARAGNVIMKIDMSKAYDRVSWHFILLAFQALGFHPKWVDMIYRNLSNCWYNIRWDGGVYGFFKSNQGVRQGDPLSPSLFVLSMEVFTRTLNRAVTQNQIATFYSARNAKVVNQLLYADDMLLFSNGDISSIKHLLGIIETFCKNSGQVLNAEKSSIFLSKHISQGRIQNILSHTRFSEGNLPTNYLGAPLFCGRPKVEYFENLIHKVISRIQGWMTKVMSIGGRSTLIQSVLNSIPIHTMAVIPIPKSVIAKLESHFANFLWDDGDSKRRHWISWESICKPRGEGGLGFRSIQRTLDGLQAKLAWQYLNQKSLWAKYMHSKYNGFTRRGSGSWRSIASHIPNVRSQSAWVVGNGETPVNKVVGAFGNQVSSAIAGLKVSDILRRNQLAILNEHLPIHAHFPPDTSLSSGQDILVWTYNSLGKFCVKSYLKVGNQGQVSEISKIWQNWIPPKISMFAWKLSRRAIPTDDRISELGIYIVSKCQCCVAPSCETIPHLFLHGEAASMVWESIGHICNKPRVYTLSHLYKCWVSESNIKSQFGQMSMMFFLWSLWEIWKFRNSKRHEGVPTDLLATIKHQVHKHMSLCFPAAKASFEEKLALQSLSIEIKEPTSIPKAWVAWHPGNGITVNLEVSSDAKKGSAVLRDNHGSFIIGFVTGTSYQNREANLLSMLNRLLSASESKLIHIHHIQVPNKRVVDWLNREEGWPWPWTYLIRRCRSQCASSSVTYVPKKVNSAAKVLLQAPTGWHLDVHRLPKRFVAAIKLDISHTPYCVKVNEL